MELSEAKSGIKVSLLQFDERLSVRSPRMQLKETSNGDTDDDSRECGEQDASLSSLFITSPGRGMDAISGIDFSVIESIASVRLLKSINLR